MKDKIKRLHTLMLWKRHNCSDGEQISGCQGVGVTTKEKNEEVLWVDETVLHPD